MTTDYTQPPVPYILIMEDLSLEEGIEDYGQACAEAARAPLAEENARLLARIAELEREIEIVRSQRDAARNIRRYVAFVLTGDSDADTQTAADEITAERTTLRAEVEALRNRCQQAHDAILSGESDAQVLARLDYWTAAQAKEPSND